MNHDFVAATQIRHVQKVEPDFRDEFWAQTPDMRPTVGREPKATVKVCRFDHANKRVYHFPGCDHQVNWEE